ncbi:Ltp family lipoprotein [Microbacterium sp. PF5]|uniref:Ltp family lipoprotein n=1 Tax=Microbacterium sp. PF5 TaxID=2305435 RepID=UPI00109BCDBA|nr:Ltp family lipoprotein [Microbacterium sp. PF5]
MSEQTPAPGWYPAPHANNEQRYWDGARWLEPPAATAVMEAPQAQGSELNRPNPRSVWGVVSLIAGIIAFFTGIVPILGIILGLGAVAISVYALTKKQSKALAITGIVLGSIAVVSSIAVTVGISSTLPDAANKPAAVQTVKPAEDIEEEAPPAKVIVPDVVGLPVADAIAALNDAGLSAPELSTFEDPVALVVSTSRAAGSEANEGAAISIVVAEKPKLTLGQQNAVDSAVSYLNLTGFSRSGLIDQLEYEGFSPEEATFGADNAGADWNAEAAQSAEQYLEISSFSRQGLYDQLAYEGYQPAEIEYALSQVGY